MLRVPCTRLEVCSFRWAARLQVELQAELCHHPRSIVGRTSTWAPPPPSHAFMNTTANSVSFFLNGRSVTIDNPAPDLLLIDYLRSPDVALAGPKKPCGQGG